MVDQSCQQSSTASEPNATGRARVAERLREVEELLPDPEAPPAGAGAPPAPTRVYRSESARGTPRRRKIAYRVVLATAGIAFVIGAFTFTLGELVGGGSVGNNDRRTTLIGGSGKKKSTDEKQAPAQTTPEQTDTEQQPTTTEEEPTTPETQTTTTPTTPEQPPAAPLPGESTTTTPAQP